MPTDDQPPPLTQAQVREAMAAVLDTGRAILVEVVADRKHFGALSVKDSRNLAAALMVMIDLGRTMLNRTAP